MQETIDRKGCTLYDCGGNERCRGVADITIDRPADSRLYEWGGTISIIENGQMEFLDLSTGRIVLSDGRAGEIVITHQSPSLLVFKGSGRFE